MIASTVRIAFVAGLISTYAFVYTPRAAAADPEATANAVAPNVTEVTTGGTWGDGKTGGFYRTIVVLTVDKEPAAHVFLQWIVFEDLKPKVASSVRIKEVEEKKLQNAFTVLEAEKENEAKLTITSYDPVNDKDINIVVVADKPGSYKIGE